MKNTIVALVGALLFSTAPSYARRLPAPDPNGVAINVDMSKGLKLFENRFVIKQEVIDPVSLAGAFLIIDNLGTPNEKAQWTVLDPSKPRPSTTRIDKLIYRSIIDKGFATQATYLTFTASALGEDKAELAVEDLYSASGSPYTTMGVAAAANQLVTTNPGGNRRFFYIQNVKVSTMTHRVYKKFNGGGGFTGIGFGADGKVYVTNNQIHVDEIVSVNTWEIVSISNTGLTGSFDTISFRKPGFYKLRKLSKMQPLRR